MTYQYLSQQENDFISKTEEMVAKIRNEFVDEIKHIEICNWDLVQIHISKDFLDSILAISQNKNPDFNGWLDFFLEQEYFTHLNYILLIMARLFNNPKGAFSLSKIKNNIEGQGNTKSLKELIEFLNIHNNMDEIKRIDQKITYETMKNVSLSYSLSFPNLLYLQHLQSSFAELRPKCKKVHDMYEKLKLRDFRDNYLAHNLKNKSFVDIRTNFYLDNDFLDLLKDLESLLDIFYLVLKDTTMIHKVAHRGYSIKGIFKKLESVILEEIEGRNVKSLLFSNPS